MERDEQELACGQPGQDIPRWLAAFWGNQLQHLKERAELHTKGMNTGSTYDGKIQFAPGSGNGH